MARHRCGFSKGPVLLKRNVVAKNQAHLLHAEAQYSEYNKDY